MVFCSRPRRLILLGWGRTSSLSPSITRLQQSLFIIFVSMEDSFLIGVFGSIRLLRHQLVLFAMNPLIMCIIIDPGVIHTIWRFGLQ